MAQEWYLMDTDHDTVSGFESDDFESLAADAFMESLETSLGVDVEVCNYDLSIREPRRVIMEGNLQDTKLNSLNRRMLAPIGTCSAGQYVYYKNRYWLIVGLVDDNSIYEKAVLALCNYNLTWQNDNGDIIQRWASVASASQYNNGETREQQFIFVRSDQLMILTPDDDESISIKHGQRFIIDSRCRVYEKQFSPDVTVDTSKLLITYELTRMDNVVYNYQISGHCEFMVTQDEKHNKDGYYVIDGEGYWLCDAIVKKEEDTAPLSCSIDCVDNFVYVGLEPSVFVARFIDPSGDEESGITPVWEITCDFADSLNIEYLDNSVSISTTNRKLINKSFELSLSAPGYDKSTIVVKIKSLV